jgi:hypothetical protein
MEEERVAVAIAIEIVPVSRKLKTKTDITVNARIISVREFFMI